MKLFANFLLAALLGVVATAGSAADEPPAVASEAATAKATTPADPAAPAKPDLAKGEAAFGAKACASCHNADGNSAIASNPKLAQQHPEYIVKQLLEYKSGKRKNPIMNGMAATLSDAEVRDVAWFVASKKEKPGFAKEKDLVALGEKIYRGGIGERGVPACAGCHSPTGAGIPAQYPRLAGQHAEYTATQLALFRDGVRTNSPQMNGVAARLNDREIKAVSDYIAGLR
ncbi:MAG: putative cytochrome c [Variovorax sp.]|nr:putative cytochrome c [Variovorax sp.]